MQSVEVHSLHSAARGASGRAPWPPRWGSSFPRPWASLRPRPGRYRAAHPRWSRHQRPSYRKDWEFFGIVAAGS
jgi:hypothetical protein